MENIPRTTWHTFGNRRLRYWLLHLMNDNARDTKRDLKNMYNHTTCPTSCTCALMTTILKCVNCNLKKNNFFLVYTLRKSETWKEKRTHFQQGQRASCGNDYGMVVMETDGGGGGGGGEVWGWCEWAACGCHQVSLWVRYGGALAAGNDSGLCSFLFLRFQVLVVPVGEEMRKGKLELLV